MYDIGIETSSEDGFSSDSELSNETTDSTDRVFIPMYIENYLNTVQHLPSGIMREVSKIMEIDVKMQKNFSEIDTIKNRMKNSLHTKTELQGDLQIAKRKLQRILVLEEMKATSLQQVSSLIEQSNSQLEEDQGRLMQSKVLDVDTPSPNYSNEELITEDLTANTEDNEGDEDSNSSKKISKRLSANSRGRGRRSFAAKDLRDDEIDSLLSTSRGSLARKKAGRKRRDNRKSSPSLLEIDPPDPDEPRYCSCNEVSYGDMIGCDNNNCPIEWFHFRCVNLTAKPKGKWFCPNCTQDKKKTS